MKLLAVVMALAATLSWGAPSGPLPSNMPTKLTVGLFEDTGRTWMKSSGVPYQMRYRYLTYKWSSNWGFGPKNGSFAGQFFSETKAQGFMPAIAYYEIYDLPGGVSQLKKIQNPAAMAEYFNDFKLLMIQAKNANVPILVMVEPDMTGFLQGETGGNAATPAAVASTGMPELAGLPNTVAGFGLAFLQIRKSVDADKVVLGMHVSGWATSQDLFHHSVTVDLKPAVDQVANFLNQLGLAPNQTNQTYDVLVGDPLDRDADFYRVAQGQDRWWDPSNTAGINTKSFNRYAEWLRLWNQRTAKRWVLWQLPIGNANSTNVCNAGRLNQGYKDNRVAYFFGTDSAPHRRLFVDNGVVALLFGAGQQCQSSFEIDGNILKNATSIFFANGGLSLTDAPIPVVDAGTPVIDAGQPVIDAGQPVVDAGTPPPVYGGYVFHSTTNGFVGSNSTVTTVVATSYIALGVTFNGSKAATPNQVIKANPVGIPKNTPIEFSFRLPDDMPLSSVQVFVQEDSATGWKWIANWQPASLLKLGAWNKLSVTTSTGNLQAIGIEFQFTAPYSGTAYVETILWSGPAPVVDAGKPDAGTPVVDAGRPDAGTPTIDAGQPVVDAGTPPTGVRLSPVGDSITAEEWAWRCQLSKLLPGVAFVGTVTNQYDVACAPKHEGHPGFTAGNVDTSMTAWLQTTRPEIVVLMVGTNDVAWWTAETGTQVADRINAMITKIQNILPGVRIVATTIPPQSSSIVAPNGVDRALLTQQLNARHRSNMAIRINAGQRVALADVNSVLALSDLRDGIHPTTAAGINKIAPEIHSAVKRVVLVP